MPPSFVSATPTLVSESSTMPAMPVSFLPTSCCSGVSPPRPPTALRSAESRRSHIFSMATATVAAAAATTMATTSPSSSLSFGGGGGGGGGNNNAIPPLPPIFSTAESISVAEMAVDDGVTIRCEFDHQAFYTTGCEKRLLNWLRSSLDILFVLGYCVISFLKLCFLGILRYEIREMIQKIRILRSEQRNNVECQDSSLTGLQKLQQIRRYDHNGSVVGVAQPLLESRNNDCGSVTSMDGDNGAEDADGEISATSPLLVPTEKRYRSQENVATGFGSIAATSGSRLNLCHRPQRHLCVLNTDAANDSDTNSHCALIVADEGNRWKTKAPRSASAGGNSNNNYELQELQEFEKIKSSRNRNKI
ncbi:hypothetical protein V9T40_006787 [Parthenolecanium corni]|uniref:Uncharacterized protein n=1 Tax=Parthenolecanium corni TaxID=536013 RepID=A0AAN9U1Z1_9HEMI